MKKLVFALSALGIIVAASSCKNTELTKRHYTKGYYVHKARSVEAPKATDGLTSEANAEKVAGTDVMSTKAVAFAPQSAPELKGQIVENSNAEFSGFYEQKTSNNAKQLFSLNKSLKSDNKSSVVSSQYKTQGKTTTTSSNNASDRDILLIILCIFLPPLAVYLHENDINTPFWIDLILTLLFWLPGIIYAFIVCFA